MTRPALRVAPPAREPARRARPAVPDVLHGRARLATIRDGRPLPGDLTGLPLPIRFVTARREREEERAASLLRFYRVWVPLGLAALLAVEYLVIGGGR